MERPVHRRFWKFFPSLCLAGLICAAGCKENSKPPPPETDPEKLKQLEKQAEQAGKQEGKAKREMDND